MCTSHATCIPTDCCFIYGSCMDILFKDYYMESNVSIVHYSILSLFRFLVIFWTSDRSSSVPKIVW